MKIIVDHAACSGHGRCAAVAPSVYGLDADGYNRMPDTDVPEALAQAARAGANNCPERVITVVE